MLHEAGYATRRDPKELIVSDPRNDAEFFYLRPRDIATYVGSGALDVGITGRDLLLDSASAAVEVDELDFGASTFRFAGPIGRFETLGDLAGVRVATSYDGLVAAFLEREGVAIVGVHKRFSTLSVMASGRWHEARVVAQYDHERNPFGRADDGSPITRADDRLTVRAQVGF